MYQIRIPDVPRLLVRVADVRILWHHPELTHMSHSHTHTGKVRVMDNKQLYYTLLFVLLMELNYWTVCYNNQPCLIKPKIRIVGIDKRLVRNFTKEKNAIVIVARVTSQTKSNLPADDDIFWPGGRIQLQPTVFDWAENKDNHNKKESVRNFSKVKKSSLSLSTSYIFVVNIFLKAAVLQKKTAIVRTTGTKRHLSAKVRKCTKSSTQIRTSADQLRSAPVYEENGSRFKYS